MTESATATILKRGDKAVLKADELDHEKIDKGTEVELYEFMPSARQSDNLWWVTSKIKNGYPRTLLIYENNLQKI